MVDAEMKAAAESKCKSPLESPGSLVSILENRLSPSLISVLPPLNRPGKPCGPGCHTVHAKNPA